MEESMDDIFAPIIDMFQAGAWLIVRTLLFYIVIPEIVIMLVLGLVFKIRGKMFGFIMTLVTLVLFYLFVKFGLPYIAEETTNLAKEV